jgi:hypothetical protein
MMVLALIALAGLCAFVIDVGFWFRETRQAQAAADASALAGAQVLPNTSAATSMANDYASKNGRSASSITFSSKYTPNDTVSVSVESNPPGFFAQVLGIKTVRVRARAAAQAEAPASVRQLAPVSIGIDNPQLQCGPPCYGQEIDLIALPTGNNNGNMTNFALIDLSKHAGNVSPAQVAEWLRHGYDGYLSPGQYPGVGSKTFNTSEFRRAMDDMKGKPIVVLVHSDANGNEGDPGALYTEVGWAGFVITKYSGSGAQGTLRGYFTEVHTNGIPSTDPNQKSWGVKTITLTE